MNTKKMKEKNAFLFNLYKFYPDKTVVTQRRSCGREEGRGMPGCI